MDEISGKTVLITGASSGIGRELALVFASKRNDLIIVARRENRLLSLKQEIEAAYGVSVTCIAADLAKPDGARKVLDTIDAARFSIDVLVNNAGYSLPGMAFHDRELPEYFDLMHVGITSSMTLTHALLPRMRQQRYGRIMIMASIAGCFTALRNHSIYCATKAFLIRLGLSINEENKRDNVSCSVICPGYVESEFHTRAGSEEVIRQLPSWLVKTSARAARESYEALCAKRPRVILGAPNKIIIALLKYMPVSWELWLFNRSGL